MKEYLSKIELRKYGAMFTALALSLLQLTACDQTKTGNTRVVSAVTTDRIFNSGDHNNSEETGIYSYYLGKSDDGHCTESKQVHDDIQTILRLTGGLVDIDLVVHDYYSGETNSKGYSYISHCQNPGYGLEGSGIRYQIITDACVPQVRMNYINATLKAGGYPTVELPNSLICS